MMKSFWALCLWGFIATVFASSIALSPEQEAYLKEKKVVTMCVDPDWAPFETINADKEHEGIAADLIRLIASKLDLTLRLVPTKTWEETVLKSKRQECDLLSLVNQTPKREEWLVFTEPIIKDPNVLVARSDYPPIDDIRSLRNTSIALLKETFVIERFQNDFPNLKILPVDTEEEAFWMVENKKADLTLRSLMVTAYTIKKESIFNLKVVAQPKDYVNILRIGVRKDEPILRDILNRGIQAITPSEKEHIVNKHIYIKVESNERNHHLLIYGILTLLLISSLILIWNYQLRKRVAQEVKKNLEHSQMLFQQSKQAALGALIATISHQWRESLTKISYANLTFRAHILQHKKIPDELLDKNTREIEQTLDFMSETMQNFLEYYKPSTNVYEFEVEDSIRAVIRILDTRIKNLNVAIAFHQTSNTHFIGIRNEWMQVWMNLLSNMLNMAQKRAIKYPYIEITISENAISFHDNCGGIEPEILEKLNKGSYKNGLGINMSREIVEKYGKSLFMHNLDQGAQFMIVSP